MRKIDIKMFVLGCLTGVVILVGYSVYTDNQNQSSTGIEIETVEYK